MGIETALLGSAVIGGFSANSQARSAEKAQANSDRLNANSLAQQQRSQLMNEQRYLDQMADYEKMKAIYGPIQEDIGTYFKNLTGESLSNDRVAKLEQASQEAKDKLQQNLAQSGRSNSGLESYLLAQQDYSTEIAKAATRASAEDEAIQQKLGYLGLATNTAQTSLANANTYANAAQSNINNQGQIQDTMGVQGINSAARVGNIYGNYANQLQGLIGFKYRKGEANA